MGIAAILITLAMSIRASAAVSEGPKPTNAAAAEELRFRQFYDAQQSYQEKLKVGRERYEKKQVERAKVIQAMSAQLQARQQTLVIHPVGVPDEKTGQTTSQFQPLPAAMALAVGFIAFGYYLKRRNQTSSAPVFPDGESGLLCSCPVRATYRITALKPVAIWANMEVPNAERKLPGSPLCHTEDKPAWIKLKAGEMRDKVGLVLGIHPECAPNERRVYLPDAEVDIVPLGAWTDGELPKNFFEYFVLEVSK
jgi:hypothetical protein